MSCREQKLAVSNRYGTLVGVYLPKYRFLIVSISMFSYLYDRNVLKVLFKLVKNLH